MQTEQRYAAIVETRLFISKWLFMKVVVLKMKTTFTWKI